MIRYRMEAALIAVLGLLALAVVLHSATGGEQMSVLVLAIVLSVAAVLVSFPLIGYRRATERRVFPVVVALVIFLGILVSVATTHWPLRLAYAFSREAFDRVARRLHAGEPIATPVRAGWFTIRRAELSPQGIACLWINPGWVGARDLCNVRRRTCRSICGRRFRWTIAGS